MIRSKCTALLAAALSVFAGGCAEDPSTPQSQVFVLVDLSETWHRPEQDERNKEVLVETGYGVALAAEEMTGPVLIQYRVIGAGSLERRPLCDTVFLSRLAPVKSTASYEITKRSDLDQFLGANCPEKIVKQPAEPLTEISAALMSVANQPSFGSRHREILVISDFLEEARIPITLESDLTGFHVTLLYRPISEDYDHPASMRTRVDDWKRLMVDRGATVDAVPDTAVKRTAIAASLAGSRP